MMSLRKLIPTVVATLICWLSVALVGVLTPSASFIRDVAIGFAFLITATLWAAWAISSSRANDAAVIPEKAKRSAGTDADAAMLLELLNEDERREVRERLLERLQADGETASLDELLDKPSPKARRAVD
jgi:hypothetical protein